MNGSAVMDTRYGFNAEQIDVIKATIAPGATNEELSLFLMVCQKTGLDPFSRQIYLSERWTNGVSKKSPETTIDGFRVIAERSGKYAGQVGPFWCGSDGAWKDVWLENDMPAAAKVGILRSDFKEPVWGVALFLEYAQYKKARDGQPPQLNSMWQKMGANQLAKCAESLGLRKAFPRDLSGMYTREEMAQADKDSIDNAKQAQSEVAERRIAELKQIPNGSTVSPAEIADTEPSYEERHTALVLEANAVLDEATSPMGGWQGAMKTDGMVDNEPFPSTKKPKKEKPPSAMTDAAKKRWLQVKMQLRAVTGDDKAYYGALGKYKHCTEIATKQEAEVIWKALQAALAPPEPRQQDKALRLELETYQLAMSGERFFEVIGGAGFETTEDILLNANGDQLQGVLRELKAAMPERNA